MIAKYLIKSYQMFISPFLPACCRFYPTCSEYALKAFGQYSFPKALWLSLRRILRCNPFHGGGYDPLV